MRIFGLFNFSASLVNFLQTKSVFWVQNLNPNIYDDCIHHREMKFWKMTNWNHSFRSSVFVNLKTKGVALNVSLHWQDIFFSYISNRNSTEICDMYFANSVWVSQILRWSSAVVKVAIRYITIAYWNFNLPNLTNLLSSIFIILSLDRANH